MYVFHAGGVFKIFVRGHQILTFFKCVLSGRVNLEQFEGKSSKRSGGTLPRKCFEILHHAMAISVLFEQIFLNFVPLVRSPLPRAGARICGAQSAI